MEKHLLTKTASDAGNASCHAALNPYGCQAPSRDRFDLDYYGGELTAGWNTGGWQWHGSAGVVRTELDVQVDALTNGLEDRSHLFARGYRRYFAVGTRYALAPDWSLAAELLYVPLQVRRGPGSASESDPLLSLRLQLGYGR